MSGQVGAEQNTRIAGLEQERDSLSHAAEQRSKEMAALQAELQQLRDALSSEKESSRKERETLQTQLQDKVPQEHPKHRHPCAVLCRALVWQHWVSGCAASTVGP